MPGTVWNEFESLRVAHKTDVAELGSGFSHLGVSCDNRAAFARCDVLSREKGQCGDVGQIADWALSETPAERVGCVVQGPRSTIVGDPLKTVIVTRMASEIDRSDNSSPTGHCRFNCRWVNEARSASMSANTISAPRIDALLGSLRT